MTLRLLMHLGKSSDSDYRQETRTLVPVTLRLRRLSVEIDNISIEGLVKRLAKSLIGFGVSYLDCFAIK